MSWGGDLWTISQSGGACKLRPWDHTMTRGAFAKYTFDSCWDPCPQRQGGPSGKRKFLISNLRAKAANEAGTECLRESTWWPPLIKLQAVRPVTASHTAKRTNIRSRTASCTFGKLITCSTRVSDLSLGTHMLHLHRKHAVVSTNI